MGTVKRKRLLPRVREDIGGHEVVRVTTARQTVGCMYIQREKVCDS
jgi:hypothetical protein